MTTKFGPHTEDCEILDSVAYEAPEDHGKHFGEPRHTENSGHSCECSCHRIWYLMEDKVEGPVTHPDDDLSWRRSKK